MEEYVTGDIVLLSDAKIGILTSPSTVREIRGDDTDVARIVKKLTAKELAETLVDLMERYNNLETKSSQQLLKEGNTESTTNTNTRSTGTTLSCTKHTKSSKTTSSSEPKPKSINNDLEIPKTPNYGNHTISPTDSKQHVYYGHHQATYMKTKRERGSDNSSVKSNDESATNTTTASTISDLSPNLNEIAIEHETHKKSTSKSPKPKKKLFGKMRKTGNKKKHDNNNKNTGIYTQKQTENVPKTKSSRFLFKSKNRKKKKRSKRSSSSETHYLHQHHDQHLVPQHLQQHPINTNVEYVGYTAHEFMPYHHEPHISHLHPHSHPDDIMHIEHTKHKTTNHHLLHPHPLPTHLQHNNAHNAPKTRFSRSKSTDNYAAYHHSTPHTNAEHHHHVQHSRYHNPYFIAYTPSHNTNHSNTTPPIPSPAAIPYHIPPYVNHYLAQLSPNTSSYSSTAPAPIPMQPSPYALYNRYNLHFHPQFYSNIGEEKKDKLIDVLLSVPHRHNMNKEDPNATTPNKKKSHPISYKKRTIKQLSSGNTKGGHCADGLLMASRTALTESVSPNSQSRTPPTYPQQYVPSGHVHSNQMILNLLNSPETQSVVDPIMANYSHIKHLQNRSNTIDTEDTTHTMNREREIYLNYNNYPENSYSQSNAKRDRKIMNQYISSNTNNNDSMIYNDSTSIRGGSHSPHNSSYSFRRKNNYHHSSPRGSHPYHAKRPFSATNKHQKHNKFNNYPFDFAATKTKQRLYHKTSYSTHNKHNHHHAQQSMTKSNTIFSEIEGKNEYSSQNKTAAIKPFHPQTAQLTQQKYKKPKLTQKNYSTPVTHNDDVDYLIHTKLKQTAYRKQRGKTMGHDINLELGLNLNDRDRWGYFASDASRNTATKHESDDKSEEEEETETIRDLDDAETVINHDLSNQYNEGRKSQSFSVLALGKSLDDMTPLVLSPQSKQKAAYHDNKPRRSQSVADIFDPMHPSHLGDGHELNLNAIGDLNSKKYGAAETNNNDTDERDSADTDERDKNYKIVLHKAYYDDLTNQMQHNQNAARFSQSTSHHTAQSAQSFTPTMSQTPSYLREQNVEDAKWAKSMTAKISQSTAASQCSDTESDSRWMLHNHINVNGGTAVRFFGDDNDDEIGGFPEIDLNHHDDPSSQLSTKHIANEDELEMQIQMKRNRTMNKYKNQLSPSTNTSDTDTISKSYIY